LQVSQDALKVRPELRAPANESDPMHIILALWRDNILRAASIGFIPRKSKPNDAGGLDFEETELLEISIVPLPANQDALRLALKAFEDRAGSADPYSTLTLTGALPVNEPIMTGRVILRQVNPTVTVDPALLKEPAMQQSAWVRRAEVESRLGKQTLFAVFRSHHVDVPEDATLLQMDAVFGECTEVPHPDAGKTVAMKDAILVPPLEFAFGFEDTERDAVYVISGREQDDEKMIDSDRGLWSINSLSDVLVRIDGGAQAKAVKWNQAGFGTDVLTQGAIDRARDIVLHSQKRAKAMLTKRGRVLSAKNEGKLREARDELDRAHAHLDDVLKEVEEQPELPREEAAPANLLKGAIPPHESPKADPDAEWDGPGMVAACPAERGALRRMHAWFDEKSDPDAKQSYKFPHHLLDGRVVLRGVNNAKARLAQADIPDEDRAGVERHLNQHQDQFERAAALNEQAEHEGSDSERDLADVLKHLTRELGTIYEEVIP
jgi:hypothetical protein